MMRSDVSRLGRRSRGAFGYLRGQRVAIFASVALSTALGACARDGAARTAKTTSETSASLADSGASAVLATIGDEKITLADVRARTGDQLDQLEGQYLRSRDKIVGGALDSIVHDRLITAEVKKTGRSADQLLAAEMTGSATPSEVEIAAWYNDNQSR